MVAGTLSNSIEFYDGTGNTFYFLELSLEIQNFDLKSLREFAKSICTQTRPADGLVIWNAIDNSKIEMLIVNSDGSLASTCGNALRCLGLALIKKDKWDGKTEKRIFRLILNAFQNETFSAGEAFATQQEAFATLFAGEAISSNCAYVTVDMGAVRSLELVDTELFTHPKFSKLIQASYFVELANPHWVFLIRDDVWNLETCTEFGKLAQTVFKDAAELPVANIGMLWPQPQKSPLVVYERGAGLTQCCGSGACAAAAVQNLILRNKNEFQFEMPGGEVSVKIDDNKKLILSGTANHHIIS